jgi:3-deoxy-D-manno-octulosonic-acid transferase
MRSLYVFLTYLIYPFLKIILKHRVQRGKEDKQRHSEKLGITNIKTENNVIWFHVSSLGEIKSIDPIIKYFQQKTESKLLITSVTLSSYEYFEKELKHKNTYHQFAPLDNPIIIKKFLKNWQPKIAIFVESEIWPNLITQTSKECKLILLNCRISKNSYKIWKFFKKSFKKILDHFEYIVVQNQETEKFLKFFGIKNIKYFGNLKFIQNTKIDKNKITINSLPNSWAAMSIHFEEVELILEVHLKLNLSLKELTTFIIPRHLNKIHEIENKIKNHNLNYVKISNQKEINDFNGIVLVDQFGVADSVFEKNQIILMGGSFKKHGGQNPIEPLAYGCKILHGEHIFNFSEIYNELNNKKIAFLVRNKKEVEEKILQLLANKDKKTYDFQIKNMSDEIFNKTISFLKTQIN